MKKFIISTSLLLVTLVSNAQVSPYDLRVAIGQGYIPGQYIQGNSIPVYKIKNVALRDSSGNLGIGSITGNPKEQVHINGGLVISAPSTYSGVTNGATTPVPNGQSGTLIFINGHFYGWIGTAWKQLDN